MLITIDDLFFNKSGKKYFVVKNNPFKLTDMVFFHSEKGYASVDLKKPDFLSNILLS